MSWESSLEYYRIINETVKDKLGGLHSAKIIMYSVDFEEIEILQHQDKWKELVDRMINLAKNLEKSGADLVLICSNTMHKMAEQVQESINIPLLHIADATAEKIKRQGLKNVGLLGTKFTMEQDFYKDRLRKHGINVIIPSEEERQVVHAVIYNELCLGRMEEFSKKRFKEIIDNLVANGSEGIILGCTEIPLLIKQEDIPVPLFDTTEIHAKIAAEYAIKE